MQFHALRLNTLVFLIVLGLSSLRAFPSAAADPAAAPVEAFNASLINVMKDAKDKKPIQERYAKLAPAVSQSFSMATVAYLATADYYAKATPDQRDRLAKAFQNYGISRLVTLFDGYSGESFETAQVKDGSQGTKLVVTKLKIPSKDAVGITYVVKQVDNRWSIIDALLDDSISQVSVQRSEYRKLLAEQGIEGLIKILNEKASDLLKG
jgi:phospholipid transport system substrate-binding protein